MLQARIISAILVCAPTLVLAACNRSGPVEARVDTARTQTAKPSLWRIEAINDGKVVGTAAICADQTIQSAFVRPTPEFENQPCDRAPSATDSDGTYTAKCRMNHENYVISATRSGDFDHDFKVDMSVARQSNLSQTFEQTRHYVRVGDCPPGWRVGDTAAPGDRRVASALATSPASR